MGNYGQTLPNFVPKTHHRLIQDQNKGIFVTLIYADNSPSMTSLQYSKSSNEVVMENLLLNSAKYVFPFILEKMQII